VDNLKLEVYCPFTDRCHECCLETEMALSEKDITDIVDLGYKIDEFLEEKDGFMVLKNIDGHCFFLKNNLCKIYEHRPQGCRFYPLIYDFEDDEFVIDNLCSHYDDFDVKIYQPLYASVRLFIFTLLGEKRLRLKKMHEEKEKEKDKRI
jgi:Fe-S-cluster containining protein